MGTKGRKRPRMEPYLRNTIFRRWLPVNTPSGPKEYSRFERHLDRLAWSPNGRKLALTRELAKGVRKYKLNIQCNDLGFFFCSSILHGKSSFSIAIFEVLDQRL